MNKCYLNLVIKTSSNHPEIISAGTCSESPDELAPFGKKEYACITVTDGSTYDEAYRKMIKHINSNKNLYAWFLHLMDAHIFKGSDDPDEVELFNFITEEKEKKEVYEELYARTGLAYNQFDCHQ
jgi:hypothetical protein